MTRSPFLPPELPPGIEPLAELALDLRWTWSHDADHLWRALDPETWEATANPWLLLQNVSRARLAAMAADPAFRRDLERILSVRRAYLDAAPALDGGTGDLSRPVAYFSLEFGIGEAIPLYAGGLGVLAGDHLKAASDLGVPLVAVGLLYQEGYFRQTFDASGRQEELYPYNDPVAMPIQPTLAADGSWLTVPVELPGRTLQLRSWRATVGRVTLHLLDSNVPINDPVDRGITGKLYGDGPEMRLRQEMVLGIGGWRLLEAAGVQPGAVHLNEGHAAFAILERARSAMAQHQLSFREALAATRAGNVFTTHTPVAAGFDAFSPKVLAKYFPEQRGYLASLGISFDELLALGRAPGAPPDEPFRPSYLALRGATRVNGVSALHAETSREVFRSFFPRWPKEEIPIRHVTNGVHVPSWDSAATDELWTAACGAARWRGSAEGLEAAIAAVDDRRLWSVRCRAREELVHRARARLQRHLAHRGASPDGVELAARVLDPDVLTLGFARRFAEYKRPNLLLRDEPALRRLLGNRERPVQILIAGKAHPDDAEGKLLVEAWTRFAADPDVRMRCVFLEDYDLSLAQELVQGVDVWINTPRRPWEACGTSGMKVLVNGGLNLSALDGWWIEAYAPDLGWAIGDARGPSDDARDAAELVRLLEQEIAPLFYDRDGDGLPRAWLARVRASMSRLTPRFSANRMMRDYVTGFYHPAEVEVGARLADHGALARALESWTHRMATCWPQIRFGTCDVRPGEDEHLISAEVFLNDVPVDDVAVELFAAPIAPGGDPVRAAMAIAGPLPGTSHGFLFRGTVPSARPVSDWTPRVIPAAKVAAVPSELPLITWLR
ncbi:MAG TPA: alpha-glucan family phosphorylase [Polyangia bacterium]|nr:alpha-glucan family phosphorylase [Polyangia bacterium]